MKKEKKPPIKLADYSASVGDLQRFGVELRNRLESQLFRFDSMDQMYFAALSEVEEVQESLNNDSASITNGIHSILDHFGILDRKATTTKLSNEETTPVKGIEKSQEEVFQQWILGYQEVPLHVLEELLPRVEAHLRYMNDLIIHYEELPQVRKYLDKRDVKKDPESRLILEFYVRSLKERQIILDYHLNGVYTRALEKSRAHILSASAINAFEIFKDFPYDFAMRSTAGSHFDYRNIDKVTHRVNHLPIGQVMEHKKLYNEDKKAFYQMLFKTRSRSEIFQRIFYHLDYVPLSKERKPIFEELQRLFKGKKWLAFYALGLPQVEGLFGEMVESANPKSDVLTRTLHEKVGQVRPDYDLSWVYFDYYQYVLPSERNAFSHTGWIEDYEPKAYDILTDLDHVLSVFAELKNPTVRLTKMIRRKDQMAFANYKDYARYYRLVDGLNSGNKMLDQIEDFNGFLLEYCSAEYIIEQSSTEIKESLGEVNHKIKDQLAKLGIGSDWSLFNKDRLIKLADELDEGNPDSNIYLFQGDFEDVDKLDIFFAGSKKVLYGGKVPEKMKPFFQHWETNHKYIKWLRILYSVFD